MPNHVKTKIGRIHYYAEPNEVPILIRELVDWYNTAKDDAEINTIALATFFHHRFVAIHPLDIQISLLIKYEKLCLEIFYSFEFFGERSYFSELNDEGNKKFLLKQPYHKPLSNTEIKAATKIVSDALLQKIKELSNT